MSKTEEYVPTPQQFRSAEQAADRYKAERDRAVALLREFREYDPTSDASLYAWRNLDASVRAFLKEVDHA